MIDKQARLFKLLSKCSTYAQFERLAIAKSHWVLAPYAQDGYIVNKVWLQGVWILNRGERLYDNVETSRNS